MTTGSQRVKGWAQEGAIYVVGTYCNNRPVELSECPQWLIGDINLFTALFRIIENDFGSTHYGNVRKLPILRGEHGLCIHKQGYSEQSLHHLHS
ncbi:hypothetical protein ACH79_15960 [Bradyrhizobium sp. CCBAU 051011]|nr:hypothetical protein ACH79_15960 [Bradyrhizobium sp. CCBAU 051011]